MITGTQIRAARALLNWSADEAATRARVARKTVERLEQTEGQPAARALTMASLQEAFEAAGVEFVGSAEDGPGVRLWPKQARKLRSAKSASS